MKKEIISRKEKIERLKEKIAQCKEYKVQLCRNIDALQTHCKHENISLEEYKEIKKEHLKGWTLERWYDYYDDMIKRCNIQIRLLKKEAGLDQRKALAIEAVFVVLFLVAALASPFFSNITGGSGDAEAGMSITGFLVYEPENIFNETNETKTKESVETAPLFNDISLREEEIQENFGQVNVLSAFTIDTSQIKAKREPVRKVASARSKELWKCDNWDSAQGICSGAWEKIMDISSGKEYQFIPEGEESAYVETGVASINTRKSLYHPGETAEIIMVVLDRQGHLVDDAHVNLTITDPDTSPAYYSTAQDTITQTSTGIYEAEYDATALEGNYTLFVQAAGENVNSAMLSYFTVKKFYEFDILRDTPVTIDPWLGAFDSSVNLVSFIDVETFDYTEVLPDEFTVTDTGGAVETEVETEQGSKIYLTWQDLANDSTVSYSAKAPLKSPDLYEIGPSFIDYTIGSAGLFYEARPWFLAIDPAAFYDPAYTYAQGWDDGNGTTHAEIDEGVRQPNTAGMTADAVADNTQQAAGISEFGFPAITQIPLNFTLWVYTGTESSCYYTFYLQQNGITRCSYDVGVGSPDSWTKCNWSSPTGDYSNMTIELSTVQKGTGTHSTCYVYEAYLEVNYNNDPNVTALLDPENNANLTSGTAIDFNFTVTDNEVPINNCTLWGNFSGLWGPNTTIFNVANNTETNITISLSDGDYKWNVNCTDIFGAWDMYDTNYTLTIDSTYPQIDFSAIGTEDNDTYFSRDWVAMNVTVTEIHEKNITFFLYNSSGLVNNVTYTDGTRIYNFTGLDSDMEYWYNVTVCDEFGWCNTTETRKITLDMAYPMIDFSGDAEDNDTYFNRTWVYMNVTVVESNEKNITFFLYNSSGLVSNVTYIDSTRNHNFTGLDSDMEYWYNVTVCDVLDLCNTTETRKITLDSTRPGIFSLVSPDNETVSNDLTPLLTWSQTTDDNFDNYTIQVDDDHQFTSVEYTYHNLNTVANTTYQVTAAWLTNTVWFWRVIAYDAAGLDYTTGYYIYETDTAAPQVTLISPQDNTIDPDGNVTFYYTVFDSALDYCELYTNLSGWGVEDTDNNPSDGLNSFEVNGITVNTTFHWNVRCYDNFTYNSFYSENWTVTIGVEAPYQNVTLPSNVTVNNSAPIVSNMALSSPINLLAGTTTEVNCTAQIIDYNGVSDINFTNATLYHNSVASTAPLSNETKYNTTCSCVEADNMTQNCTCTFDIWYYADSGTWTCNITAMDIEDATGTDTIQTTINTLRAVNITPTSLDYGDIVTNEISEELNVSLINLGNTIIDISAFAYGSVLDDGLAMACDEGNISVSYEKYAPDLGVAYGSMTSVSGNSAAPSQIDLNISKRQDGEVMIDASSLVYWRLQIPVGSFGVCNGTLTFVAEADT